MKLVSGAISILFKYRTNGIENGPALSRGNLEVLPAAVSVKARKTPSGGQRQHAKHPAGAKECPDYAGFIRGAKTPTYRSRPAAPARFFPVAVRPRPSENADSFRDYAERGDPGSRCGTWGRGRRSDRCNFMRLVHRGRMGSRFTPAIASTSAVQITVAVSFLTSRSNPHPRQPPVRRPGSGWSES